jgi:CRP-like cAMP-binding protein
LLAFSAKWFNIKAGDVVFQKDDDASDGAYLLQSGEADFLAPQEDGSEQHIRTLGPGALVGELALIMKEPRTLTMKARSDISGLRIGGEEFLAVLQNDPQAAFRMLQVITRYLTQTPGA